MGTNERHDSDMHNLPGEGLVMKVAIISGIGLGFWAYAISNAIGWIKI